ncbi:hypothetical protein ACK3F5_13140 [Photorhabdus asymbiotica UENP]
MTGVSESSQQSSNLKDEGYIQSFIGGDLIPAVILWNSGHYRAI